MAKRTPRAVKFVVGIEDKNAMIWELAVFLESLFDKLPKGWETLVVICNNHRPFSPELEKVLAAYQVRWLTAVNHPENENIDFASGSHAYVGINKITALETAAAHVSAGDIICLLDTDIFLYGDLNAEIFPQGNALCQNWLTTRPLFFSHRALDEGVSLEKLLDAIGCKATWKGGGVTIFLTGETARNTAFVRDCYRFAQVLFLLGKIKKVNEVHLAEMPAYALALTVHDIRYEVLSCPEFSTRNIKDPEVPKGAFYHYYGGRGAFPGSPWRKFAFRKRNLLEADLVRFKALAQSDHEKYFFDMAEKARDRISGSPAESKRLTRIRDLTADRLAYLRYHVRNAADPMAPDQRDLRLPAPISLLYKGLEPVRGLKNRLDNEQRRKLRRKSARLL